MVNRFPSLRITHLNALSESEKYISEIKDYPLDRYSGNGIVIPAGGYRYLSFAWINVNMLRYLGCQLPIQIWYCGHLEQNNTIFDMFEPLNVKFVDVFSKMWQDPCKVWGLGVKSYATINCEFENVILMDSDDFPVIDPSYLLKTEQFLETGGIFWPDLNRIPPYGNEFGNIWKLCGVRHKDEPEFETGRLVVNKKKCWKALRLTNWYNEHYYFYYNMTFGDKDTWHMAWRKFDQPYSMPGFRATYLDNVIYQNDFEGKRIFQHRYKDEFTLELEKNRHVPSFLNEDLCFRFMIELRKKLQDASLYNEYLKEMRKLRNRPRVSWDTLQQLRFTPDEWR
jgi:alpha 1,2-mannosyltransferase